MNDERLIRGHKKEEGTAKYAKYAKNPDTSPQSRLGFACFAYFAVQEIALGRELGLLVAACRAVFFCGKGIVRKILNLYQFNRLNNITPNQA